jgi:hypothetical protein
MENYNPLAVEKKWQFFFEEKKYLKQIIVQKKNFIV